MDYEAKLKSFPNYLNNHDYALVALIAIYVLLSSLFASFYDLSGYIDYFLYGEAVQKITLFILTCFIGIRVYGIMIWQRPDDLTRFIVRDFRDNILTFERLVKVLPIFIGFVLFTGVFTSMKTMIPVINPYHWDMYFANLDRLLHFGIDPWRLLQPILGYPIITFLINVVYNLWFIVMFTILYWQLFSLSNPQLRMRFFYSFFLIWMINGTLLAMFFSSAGPCFYASVVPDGPNPYAGLLDYLRSAQEQFPIWALSTQEKLWKGYEESSGGIGMGISAMPSIHVATAFLFCLIGWNSNRVAGIGLTLFFVLILIGSVHLGWHYAVDGYFSIISTTLIWWLSGLLVRSSDLQLSS